MSLKRIATFWAGRIDPARLTPAEDVRADYVSMGIIVLVVAGYNALFAFSFLPLTEGWFSAYAHLILEGRVPYRDFYLYLTPAYPMALAAFIGVFGDSIWALRLGGVLVVLAIALLLYRVLANRFRPGPAMFATIVAMVYYQSGVAFIPYDFTQVLTLFTMASLWMLVRAAVLPLDAPLAFTWQEPLPRWLFLAGMFASLAFLTKQSNGTFVVLGGAAACSYLALLRGRSGWRLMLAFAAGASVMPAITGAWLIATGALGEFWDQIFHGALAAKGTIGTVIFAWHKGVFTPGFAVQMRTVTEWTVATVLASIVVRVALVRFDRPIASLSLSIGSLAALALVSIAAIAAAYFGLPPQGERLRQLGLQVNNYLIPVAITLAVALVVIAGLARFVPTARAYLRSPLVVIAIVSLGMIWGNGTSAGLSEISVFVMVAVAIAAVLQARAFSYVGVGVVLVLSASLVFMFAARKFNAPYSWWGLAEPDVRSPRGAVDVPRARGLLLSLATADDLKALSDSLARAPKDGDIFAFPNIPSIYLMADRWPESRVVIPWFDFLPDRPAQEEARRLLASPPATIVNLRLPAVAWDAHERLFRGGQPMGQRDIQAAIAALTDDRKKYRLDLRREVSPGSVLEVWHRK